MSTANSNKRTQSTPRVRGFAVLCNAWIPPVTSIIRTVSPARAKFLSWSFAREAGYKVQFADFRVKRAPQFDHAKLIKDFCYASDFAETVIETALTPQA